MSIVTLRQDIETHLTTNFTAYPIKYENVSFKPPNNTPWIACHIKRNSLPTPEINQTNYEVSGLLIIQVFTPLDSGTVESNSIVNTLATLYSNQSIINTWFKDAEIIDVGESDTWYQVNLSIPFIYLGV